MRAESPALDDRQAICRLANDFMSRARRKTAVRQRFGSLAVVDEPLDEGLSFLIVRRDRPLDILYLIGHLRQAPGWRASHYPLIDVGIGHNRRGSASASTHPAHEQLCASSAFGYALRSLLRF